MSRFFVQLNAKILDERGRNKYQLNISERLPGTRADSNTFSDCSDRLFLCDRGSNIPKGK